MSVPTERVCSIEGCDRPVLARGWCRRHYTRWYSHGDPRAAFKSRSRYRWTEEEVLRIDAFLDRGWSASRIAREFGCSAKAIQIVRHRHGLAKVAERHWSIDRLMRLFGFSSTHRVMRWIRAGALRASHTGPPRGAHREWRVSDESLWAFIANPDYWHEWEPAWMTDAAIREWALEVRGRECFLGVAEVALRFGVGADAVRRWIRTGALPARGGFGMTGYAIREADLASFVPPDRRRYPTAVERMERRAQLAGVDWEELRPGVRILRLSRSNESGAA